MYNYIRIDSEVLTVDAFALSRFRARRSRAIDKGALPGSCSCHPFHTLVRFKYVHTHDPEATRDEAQKLGDRSLTRAAAPYLVPSTRSVSSSARRGGAGRVETCSNAAPATAATAASARREEFRRRRARARGSTRIDAQRRDADADRGFVTGHVDGDGGIQAR